MINTYLVFYCSIHINIWISQSNRKHSLAEYFKHGSTQHEPVYLTNCFIFESPGENKGDAVSNPLSSDLVLVPPVRSITASDLGREHSNRDNLKTQIPHRIHTISQRRRYFSPVPNHLSHSFPTSNISITESNGSNQLSSSLSSSSSLNRHSHLSSPSFESPISSSSCPTGIPIFSLPSLASVSTRSSICTHNTSSLSSSSPVGSPPALLLPTSPMLSHQLRSREQSKDTTTQEMNNSGVENLSEASSTMSRSPSPSSSSSSHSPPYHKLFSMRSRSRSRDNDSSILQGCNNFNSPSLSAIVVRRDPHENKNNTRTKINIRRNKQKGVSTIIILSFDVASHFYA